MAAIASCRSARCWRRSGWSLLVHASHPVAYLAVWMLLGVAMSASLYDAAFATLGRIFGAGARQPITALTLAGGFASTVSWPATYLLHQRGRLARHLSGLCGAARRSWRRRCMPLCCRACARRRCSPAGSRRAQARAVLCRHRAGLSCSSPAAFAAYAFVPSGLSAHLLGDLPARWASTPATVVAIGTLFGPVAGRGAPGRIHLRAQRPSARHRALGDRSAAGRHLRCVA